MEISLLFAFAPNLKNSGQRLERFAKLFDFF